MILYHTKYLSLVFLIVTGEVVFHGPISLYSYLRVDSEASPLTFTHPLARPTQPGTTLGKYPTR